MIGWLRSLGKPRLVVGKNALYCVCGEEWCYCTERVPATFLEAQLRNGTLGRAVPDMACRLCAAGHHVWVPNGPRE